MRALYVHVPFCAKKCAYCDFASYPGREDAWDAYFAALKEELRPWGNAFSTAFIGGGTPSLVPARYIADLARGIRAGEFTIEANPGTLTPDKLKAYLDAGINRLSMGVQSFDDGLLRRIGRIHTADEAARAYDMARGAGFANVNLDLMYALPGQTMDQWAHTLARAVALGPEHVSAYSLIIEENTPIARWAEPAPDELTVEMQRYATHALAEAGYGRYEISNYAKPGYECAHNIAYWTRGEYVGVGCAAHSLVGGERFSNPPSIDEYLAGIRRCEVQKLAPSDEIEETILLGTRMTRGVPLAALPDRAAADELVRMGLAEITNDRFILTERGLEVQNAAVLKLAENI
jgi:oxygen-independent coproporphyrinogen-3 oxidase